MSSRSNDIPPVDKVVIGLLFYCQFLYMSETKQHTFWINYNFLGEMKKTEYAWNCFKVGRIWIHSYFKIPFCLLNHDCLIAIMTYYWWTKWLSAFCFSVNFCMWVKPSNTLSRITVISWEKWNKTETAWNCFKFSLFNPIWYKFFLFLKLCFQSWHYQLTVYNDSCHSEHY